jgi:hypothetical protein
MLFKKDGKEATNEDSFKKINYQKLPVPRVEAG